MKEQDAQRVILSLAETLSVEDTCAALGISKEELRRILLGLVAQKGGAGKKPGRDAFHLYVDGASRGNPGPAGAGILIERGGETLEGMAQYLGEKTNNQAEYEALILGLERLREIRAVAVEVRSDSELLVKQIKGEYRVRNRELRNLYNKAADLIREFESFSIRHIPREENRDADLLANRAIDEFD